METASHRAVALVEIFIDERQWNEAALTPRDTFTFFRFQTKSGKHGLMPAHYLTKAALWKLGKKKTLEKAGHLCSSVHRI